MGLALSTDAIRQWADYRHDDEEDSYFKNGKRKPVFYVNVYYDFGEGFIRRETVKDELTERKAIALCKALNKSAELLGNNYYPVQKSA